MAAEATKSKKPLYLSWNHDDTPEAVIDLDGFLGDLIAEASAIRERLVSPLNVTAIDKRLQRLIPAAAFCDTFYLEELAKQRGTRT